MAKFKLNKPVLLQEEFAAGEVSNPGQNVTPAAKTEPASVAVDKTDAKGAEIRAEIIADVDTILTNLETLSKQITEEVLSEVDETINTIFESEFTESVNEDFMAELIKQAKSMKAYGVLKSSYPKLKQNLADAKANKIESEAEFDLNSDEKIGDLKDKIKAKYQKAIDKINDSDLPTPKKKAQRDAIYQARDEALSPEKSQLIKDKIAAEKSKLVKKNDAAVRDVNTAITELTGENKLEAELISKKWNREKIEIDDQFDQEAIDTELELKMKYSSQDPEAQKKLKARLEKISKEEAEEKARRAKEAEEDLKAYQSKLAEEDANASEEEKEAREKVNTFVSSSQALMGALSGGDKEKIKEANDKFKEAKAACTDATYKATQAGMSDDDAKEAKLQIEEAVNQAMEKYKVTLREITTDQKKSKEDKDQGNDPVDNNTPADDNTDGQRDLSDKEKENLEKAEAALAKAQEAGDEDKVKRYKKLIANIKDTSTLGEGFDIDASISEIEEGNAFGAARAEAIAKGEKTFKVGDEEYDVEGVDAEDKENAEEYAEEEGIATEAVVESASFKMGSIADRFRSLM